jgi:hypothetical protein
VQKCQNVRVAYLKNSYLKIVIGNGSNKNELLQCLKYLLLDVKYEGEENMSKNPVLYKSLVVGVIVLFIGIGVHPAIASVQIEDTSKNYIDIKIEICGLPWIKPYIVKLPKEKAVEIENYFDYINKQFEQVKTREEAKTILSDIVLELDEYGLLCGLSAKQAQRLVTGNYENSRITKALDKIYNKNQMSNNNNSNYLCLVEGRATYTACSGLVQTALTAFFGAIAFLTFFLYSILPNAPGYFFVLFSILMLSSALNPFPYINPFAIGYSLGFGLRLDYPERNIMPLGYKANAQSQYYPSEGFINSYGLKGNVNWSGEFWGQGNYMPSLYNPAWGSSPVGISGFTGIKIILEPDNGNTSFFGSAIKVHIGDECP